MIINSALQFTWRDLFQTPLKHVLNALKLVPSLSPYSVKTSEACSVGETPPPLTNYIGQGFKSCCSIEGVQLSKPHSFCPKETSFAKEWLPLAPFYLNGAAYDWFQWLYRNKQIFDRKHFTKKLALHFCNDSNMISDNVNTLDMMRKLDENFSYILSKLDNVQRTLSAYSQSVVADLVPLDVDLSDDDKGDPALSFDESTLVFDDLVASDSETVDDCIQASLQEFVVHDFPFGLNDGILWLSGGKLEEISGISAYKVFAEIPFRDVDMKVANSVKNDVVKPDTKVFDERFHTISSVMCDSSNFSCLRNVVCTLLYALNLQFQQ
ncbi:hypothetical protein H5410_055144 [Solanum commersonii]|uniref:Uncharacterized protein n=1 Tax=Solanum commersonii TaxID=4109 RepID=A0A9J5WHE3_SOLCO|nr:hypothetical protein H5410_055144 [Solanum commersonii]